MTDYYQEIGTTVLILTLLAQSIKTFSETLDKKPTDDAKQVGKTADTFMNLAGYGAGLMLLIPAFFERNSDPVTIALGLLSLLVAAGKDSSLKCSNNAIPFLPNTCVISAFAAVVVIAIVVQQIKNNGDIWMPLAAALFVLGFAIREIATDDKDQSTTVTESIAAGTSGLAAIFSLLSMTSEEFSKERMVFLLVMVSQCINDIYSALRLADQKIDPTINAVLEGIVMVIFGGAAVTNFLPESAQLNLQKGASSAYSRLSNFRRKVNDSSLSGKGFDNSDLSGVSSMFSPY